MTIVRMGHVGVIVEDLEAVTGFFLDLGFERTGGGSVEGEWVDKVIGLTYARVDFGIVRTPDGHSELELARFHAPLTTPARTRLLPTGSGSGTSRSGSTISTPW